MVNPECNHGYNLKRNPIFFLQFCYFILFYFIFSAPKIFPIAYALVKPFLNEVTRNKVKILGGMDFLRAVELLFVHPLLFHMP